MSGFFQDHRLKDYDPLRVPPSVPHPPQLFNQGPEEVTPYLPTCCVVVPRGNGHKITTQPLLGLIFCNALIKVSAGVGVHPVPVDIFELEVLLGWGVSWQITHPPPPCPLVESGSRSRPIAPPAGFCLERRGYVGE